MQGEGQIGWARASGAADSYPGLDLGVPTPGTATQASLLVPAPFHPLVHSPAPGLEAHEEAEAPGQAAVGGHGHHDERRHDDEAQDDEGRRAVVIQDGFAVAGCGVQHLQEEGRKFITDLTADRSSDRSTPRF